MTLSCPLRTASPNMVSPDLVTGAVVGGNTNGNDMNNLAVDTTASNKLIPYSRFFSRALNFTIFANFLLIVKIKSSNV